MRGSMRDPEGRARNAPPASHTALPPPASHLNCPRRRLQGHWLHTAGRGLKSLVTAHAHGHTRGSCSPRAARRRPAATRPTTRRRRPAAPAPGTPWPSRSVPRTSSSAAPGRGRFAAPAGRPAVSAATHSTRWPTRTAGGQTAACAATPAPRERAVASWSKPLPASALGGPLAS